MIQRILWWLALIIVVVAFLSLCLVIDLQKQQRALQRAYAGQVDAVELTTGD